MRRSVPASKSCRSPMAALIPAPESSCSGSNESHRSAHNKESAVLKAGITPVHTAMRNCTRDEGRPFGFGDQVADPKPPQAAVVKSDGGERCGNVGAMIPAGKIERGERKQTASEASKSD